MDSPDVLAELAAKTAIPITASETVTGRHAFRALLDKQAMAIVMLDPGWVGGISEAHHIAAMAMAYHRPVAPHDCTGPVAYVAGTHLCLAAPNTMIQEVVRAYAFGWYRELLTELPVMEQGWVSPPQGPGLGTRLAPGFAQRSDVTVRTSRA
jgi:L-alanine-DL-glutamate epimerase-like enolase superfamily enzyme